MKPLRNKGTLQRIEQKQRSARAPGLIEQPRAARVRGGEVEYEMIKLVMAKMKAVISK